MVHEQSYAVKFVQLEEVRVIGQEGSQGNGWYLIVDSEAAIRGVIGQ